MFSYGIRPTRAASPRVGRCAVLIALWCATAALGNAQDAPYRVAAKRILDDPAFHQWMQATIALPAEKQVEAVSAKLKELNPGFDGQLTGIEGGSPDFEPGGVRAIRFWACHVTDLSPLRALSKLVNLRCDGSPEQPSKLCDLSPLQGLELLACLSCDYTDVSDLSPLAEMPLSTLSCRHTRVTSLEPLRGRKLGSLRIDGTRIADLSPLAGMPIDLLSCSETPVSNIAPLRGMPLVWLRLAFTEVADLSPLSESPKLLDLDISGTNVADLSPLNSPELRELLCGGTKVSDLSPLFKVNWLRYVDIRNTKVNRTALRAFRKALPRCGYSR